nr:MAG TPA: hypothetical protein [Caudoviricetes sp.]
MKLPAIVATSVALNLFAKDEANGISLLKLNVIALIPFILSNLVLILVAK